MISQKSGTCGSCDQKQPVWFLFSENNLAVTEDRNGVHLPQLPENHGVAVSSTNFLGEFDGVQYFTAEVDASTLPSNIALKELRGLFGKLDEATMRLAGRAAQIVNWDKTHQYCGRCGEKTIRSETEFAMICPRCALTSYPRISPAVITAVTRGDQILLARGKGWEIFSVIAGYVEAGETLEECVAREVMEEVSIRVKNIRYFGSQPWAPSGALMVAFTAEYAGGEIKEDGIEIAEAHWFSAENLPRLPGPHSISRRLIEWFVHKTEQA